ncbi:MAG: dCMP deaminase family protein, partial [Elusimicrobiota bacterium]|nr:dCMP deaminase family protein [Elusimicrobiota bacterium]
SWLVAERSTCLRHHVGAIIVKDRKILSTGYNGAVAKTIDCLTLGCLRNQLNIPSGQRHELCRAVHAEQNAIIQAAANGVSILNSTLYCTHSPCILCAKMIANAGIKKVVISEVYPDGAYKELFNESGIETHTIQVNNLLISQKK